MTAAMVNEAEVIQHLVHSEPASQIPADEASAIERSSWESAVIQLNTPRATSNGISALVLTFGRHPRTLDTVLERSVLGRHMKELGEAIKPQWALGPKILVPGLSEKAWSKACPDLKLSSYHVVVLPGDEGTILESLKTSGSVCPALKKGVAMRLVSGISQVEQFTDVSESSNLTDREEVADSSVRQRCIVIGLALRLKLFLAPLGLGLCARK